MPWWGHVCRAKHPAVLRTEFPGVVSGGDEKSPPSFALHGGIRKRHAQVEDFMLQPLKRHGEFGRSVIRLMISLPIHQVTNASKFLIFPGDWPVSLVHVCMCMLDLSFCYITCAAVVVIVHWPSDPRHEIHAHVMQASASIHRERHAARVAARARLPGAPSACVLSCVPKNWCTCRPRPVGAVGKRCEPVGMDAIAKMMGTLARYLQTAIDPLHVMLNSIDDLRHSRVCGVTGKHEPAPQEPQKCGKEQQRRSATRVQRQSHGWASARAQLMSSLGVPCKSKSRLLCRSSLVEECDSGGVGLVTTSVLNV